MVKLQEICPDLLTINNRVRQKRKDYISYDFTRIKNDILKSFFDLAQEFESLNDFYRICVTVPRDSLKVESRLYLLDKTEQNFELVCDTQKGIYREKPKAPATIRLADQPYEEGDSYIVPILRHNFRAEGFPSLQSDTKRILGMLEVFPANRLSDSDRFFFTKYTNRIGFNLHNRQVAQQNIQHLKFINNLVRDIEHNVIVPNMYFKHIFNQLKKRIGNLEELHDTVVSLKKTHDIESKLCDMVAGKISDLRDMLSANHKELLEYHATISLFLESLFRPDHFKKGHLVLRPKKCLVEKEIIVPQLEYFSKRFKTKGIAIERPKDMLEEEVPLMVDLGLLAQVYSNFFSNAVKYTETIHYKNGSSRKAMAYGREYIIDFFGDGKDGIKFNVFTTGEHISPTDALNIFEDGYRVASRSTVSGEGHGLSFIRHVVEIHGGVAGYEPTAEGNNFYFVLPLHDVEPQLVLDY